MIRLNSNKKLKEEIRLKFAPNNRLKREIKDLYVDLKTKIERSLELVQEVRSAASQWEELPEITQETITELFNKVKASQEELDALKVLPLLEEGIDKNIEEYKVAIEKLLYTRQGIRVGYTLEKYKEAGHYEAFYAKNRFILKSEAEITEENFTLESLTETIQLGKDYLSKLEHLNEDLKGEEGKKRLLSLKNKVTDIFVNISSTITLLEEELIPLKNMDKELLTQNKIRESRDYWGIEE